MSTPLAIEASVLLCGYEIGYFNKADVIRWADQKILESDIPSMELIELAMCREMDPIDVMQLLRTFFTEESAPTVETQIGFIGLLLLSQQITGRSATSHLYALIHEPGTTQKIQSSIYYFDEEYEQAFCRRFGTTKKIDAELREFIAPFAEGLKQKHSSLFLDLLDS